VSTTRPFVAPLVAFTVTWVFAPAANVTEFGATVPHVPAPTIEQVSE
jgi:hypothetical protein